MKKVLMDSWWRGGDSIIPLDFTGITEVVYFGDSIMDGYLATLGQSFRELLTAEYSWSPAQNKALGGAGMWNEAKEGLSTSLGYTRASTVLMSSAGLNDIRRSNTAQTFNKVESCLNCIIQRIMGKGGIASGSSSVTRSGSFTTYNAASFGGVYPGSAIPSNCASYNTTANATWTYTFTATGIAVIFNASYPSIARGNAEIRIDGVLVDTITDFSNRYDGVSDGVYDNQKGPDARMYFGLGSGSHTIEVKALSTTAVVVDQFMPLDDPANVGAVLLIATPYILDYNKVGLDQASDAYVDQLNALKESVAAAWAAQGYKVKYAKIMPPYYLNSGVTISAADQVHPLDAGHALIKQGIDRYIDYP